MKLGIVSDLHLGPTPLALPSTDADLMILAGDIARPPQAIAWAGTLPAPVIYVAGNHEYYDRSIGGTLAELDALCTGTRVRFLERTAVIVDGVRFLGTTLWTDFQLGATVDARAAGKAAAAAFMKDFRVIRAGDDGRLFTPDDAAALHVESVAWLASQLATPHPGPTVVVTHHAPSPRSIHSRFAGSPVNAAFVSNVERLLDGKNVALWVHGHTHDSFDYVVNGTRVICNPRGYARGDAIENRAFQPGLVVEV